MFNNEEDYCLWECMDELVLVPDNIKVEEDIEIAHVEVGIDQVEASIEVDKVDCIVVD